MPGDIISIHCAYPIHGARPFGEAHAHTQSRHIRYRRGYLVGRMDVPLSLSLSLGARGDALAGYQTAVKPPAIHCGNGACLIL